MKALHAGLVAALLGAATPLFSQSSVTVLAAPAQPLIERRDGQALNFDFVIENGSADTLDLIGIELTVRDRASAIILRRFLDNNGFSPSILTVPQRKWAPGDKRLVFNPFHTFPGAHDLALLEYEFRFRRNAGAGDVIRAIAVHPQAFSPKTDLILPVGGRLLVWDGHDFYSHHRRFDFTHPAARQFGFSRNFMRYAYDFVRVDYLSSIQCSAGSGNEKYYGFGATVVAPCSGFV